MVWSLQWRSLAYHGGLRIQHCFIYGLDCSCGLEFIPGQRASYATGVVKKNYIYIHLILSNYNVMLFIYLIFSHTCSMWKFLGQGLNLWSQKRPKLLQWQCLSLNLLHHKGTPQIIILYCNKWLFYILLNINMDFSFLQWFIVINKTLMYSRCV